MGKSSGGSAPSAPDPQELAQAQSRANIDAILASQFVNSTPTFTPFGSQQFFVSPTGQYSQVQAPSQPELERIASGYALGNTVLNQALQQVPNATRSVDFSSLPGQVSALNYGGIPDRPWSLDMSSAPAPVTILDFSGAPAAPSSYAFSGLPDVLTADQFASERRRIEDSIYGRQAELLDRRFSREDDRLETRLINQGLRLGSEAYEDARRQFGDVRNDAYAGAATDAIRLGGDEMARAFGMSLQGRQQGANEAIAQGNFGADARQRAIGEIMAQAAFGADARQRALAEALTQANVNTQARQNAINELLSNAGLANQARATALQEQLLGRQVPLRELQMYAGFAPGFGMQNFGQMPNYQVAPPDISGATMNQYNSQMNAYNQQQANAASTRNSIFGLGGTLGAAAIMNPAIFSSDERMKRDIKGVDANAVLDMVRMMPTSEWSYKPDAVAAGQPPGRHIGPMAQDFQRITGKGDGRTIPTVDAFGMLLTATKALADKVEAMS